MRAVTVTIHNFRSILDQTINLSSYGLLVGENNTGKSNVIDAIRSFYEKGLKFEASRDFPKVQTTDQESWIELEFKPAPAEFADLKDEYRLPQGTFRVRKYFRTEEKDSEGKTKTGVYAYVGGSLSESRFYGFPNVAQSKFGDVIYVPSVSRLDDHTKLTGPSALRDLVSNVLKRVMDESPSYKALKSSFEDFEGGIKTETTDDGHSLDSIEKDITSEIAQWGTSFRLTVNPVGLDEIVKNLIGHEIQDATLGQTQSTASYGQGFQRSLIYTLIRVAAKYGTPKVKPKKKDFSPTLTWLLFEEPEAFLHPGQIDILNADLRKLSADDGSQVLVTTHSPQFVSRKVEDLPGLARLRRILGKTEVGQVSAADLSALLSRNQTDIATWQAGGLQVNADDLTVDMESVKYHLWLDPRRCGAFFSERVLLVEGPTEVALVTYMLDQGILPRPLGSFFVLDTVGKYNTHRFMNLLGQLGIRHYVLYDSDNGRLNIIDQTIQNSRNQFTSGIDAFPDDLEGFLGIARTDKHRKPQHVMYQIAQNKVDPAVMTSLATKISTLIGQ